MKRIITLAAIALSCTFQSCGQTKSYPSGIPAPEVVPFTVNIYQGTDLDVSMDVYIPKKSAEGDTAVFMVVCPGGGYEFLSIENEGELASSWLNSIGVATGVLHYRLPEGLCEVPVQDARRAIETARSKCSEWGIIKGKKALKVGIMGFSAGGHLASTALTKYTSPENRPDFGVLFYPVITMDPAFTHIGSRNHLFGINISGKEEPSPAAVAELTRKFSSEKNVTTDTPPVFLVHTTTDDVVPVKNSIVFYQALSDHGIKAEMHIYPTQGHGWGFQWPFSYRDELLKALERWILIEI